MLTVDGEEVSWPFSNAASISLTAAKLRLLRHESALVRILAHYDLSDFHIVKLYGSRNRQLRGVKCRRVAKVLVEHKLTSLCYGLGEARICDTVSGSKDIARLRAELLAIPFQEHRYQFDKEAFE